MQGYCHNHTGLSQAVWDATKWLLADTVPFNFDNQIKKLFDVLTAAVPRLFGRGGFVFSALHITNKKR